jgi:hypothetical protein
MLSLRGSGRRRACQRTSINTSARIFLQQAPRSKPQHAGIQQSSACADRGGIIAVQLCGSIFKLVNYCRLAANAGKCQGSLAPTSIACQLLASQLLCRHKQVPIALQLNMAEVSEEGVAAHQPILRVSAEDALQPQDGLVVHHNGSGMLR